MEKALLELIELAKTAAPELWRIALQQVDVERFSNLTATIIALIVFCISVVLFKLMLKLANDDVDLFMIVTFTGLASVLSFIFAVGNLINYVQKGMNPEFYAIKILMSLAGQ